MIYGKYKNIRNASWQCATTAEKIAEICNISMQAAKHRAERMAILEARNKYYLHPLERQVRKQFGDYIKRKPLSKPQPLRAEVEK